MTSDTTSRDYRTVLASVIFFGAIWPQTLSAHDWMAPKSAAAIENPVKQSDESVYRGQLLFRDNCAACHGEGAGGLSAKESGLAKATPDLPQRLVTHTPGDFFWKIQHGRGEMPAFDGELSDNDIWDVVNFIQSRVNKGGGN